LQARIVFVLEGGLILANFLLQSRATLGAQLRSQIDREHEEAQGKEELHVAGNHGGSWMVVDYCGGKIFFNFFALLKKVPKITLKKRDQQKSKPKKRDQEVSFFIFMYFVVVVICSRVFHL
jgi:hypothetical protein